MKIGICDWGIGGIGMLQHLRKLSNFEIVYLSDAGFTPYGKVSPEDLTERWKKVKSFFKEKGVTKIAVACNALSTVVKEEENYLTIIDSGVNMVLESQYTSIGVTGGYRTIESNAYFLPLKKSGYSVVQSVGQVLSARVEAGDLDSPNTLNDIKNVFNTLRSCEAVVLACTHYPVLKSQIKEAYPKLIILDPALKMAQNVAGKWGRNDTKPNVNWNTTGSTETMMSSARICFNEKIENPTKVII